MANDYGAPNSLPTTKEGVAALGFQSAVKLTALNSPMTVDQILVEISRHLGCQLADIYMYYQQTGIPSSLVDTALSYFQKNEVRVVRYQLEPTKAVLSLYDIL